MDERLRFESTSRPVRMLHASTLVALSVLGSLALMTALIPLGALLYAVREAVNGLVSVIWYARETIAVNWKELTEKEE